MYDVFGESPVIVLLADVPAVVENCVHVEPPSVEYCHTSQVVEADADTVTADSVTPDVEIVTDGAARSMAFKSIVVLAVIVPIDTPEYVPLNRHEAESGIPVALPEELW